MSFCISKQEKSRKNTRRALLFFALFFSFFFVIIQAIFLKKMVGFLMGLQVVISIALALVILVQNRGTGLGSLAGGGGGSGFHAERRGAEKLLYNLTIILAIAFCANAFLIPFVKSA